MARVKMELKKQRIDAIICIMNEQGKFPSPRTIMKRLNVAQSTAYALSREIVARGLAKGVPHEGYDL
jgi:DNA-binding MarR family transcriptional regulator